MTMTTGRRQPRRPVDEPTRVVTIRDADWMTRGACYGVTTDIFFTEVDELPDPIAVALCRRCPVREECLQHALNHDEDGLWGGTTRTQRDAIMSGRDRVKCPSCSSRDCVDLGRETVCLGCGLSW